MHPQRRNLRRLAARAWCLAAALATAAVGQTPAERATTDPADGVAVVANPVLKAILESRPATPADWARAAFALVDLREVDEADKFVEGMIALDLDDAAKAELVADFGSAPFVRLARTEGVSQASADFATGCLAAARAEATKPSRLDGLLAALGGADKRAADVARSQLSRTGLDGVRYCLEKMLSLADAERNPAREALVALGPFAQPAVMAMLDSADPELRKQAAWALGAQQLSDAAPLLAARAVLEPAGSDAGRAAQWAFVQVTGATASTPIAAELLDRSLRETLAGRLPGRPNAEGQIPMYQRDAVEKIALDPVPLSVDNARLVHAARLADLRLRLDPGSKIARRNALVLGLEARELMAAAGVETPEQPLLDLTKIPSDELNAAMADALKPSGRRLGYAGAAAAIAVKFGDRQNAAVLATADGKPSPLAQAVASPHPAVRWSALRAIKAMKPVAAFPGSSRVADALIRFAGGGATRLAVVATPNLERSATLGGYLASQGLEARVTNRGAEAVKLADAVDVELVLVDLAVLGPNVRETVFRLRRQPASGLVPIGLLAPDGRLGEAKRIAEDHEHVVAFPRPHSAEAVDAIVVALADTVPAGLPTVDERAELAGLAREWLTDLLQTSTKDITTDSKVDQSFFAVRSRLDKLQSALVSSGYSADAIAALGLIGTPASQRELLTAIGLRTLPAGTRRAAVDAFRESVAAHGILLTTGEINRQFERYNASIPPPDSGEATDVETPKLLSDVLDVIESKRSSGQTAVGSGQ